MHVHVQGQNGEAKFRLEPTVEFSQHGLWVLLNDEELFLPFAEFPWFRKAAVERILHLERPSPDHLYWLELDVDLAVDSIRHPERFPLVSQVGT